MPTREHCVINYPILMGRLKTFPRSGFKTNKFDGCAANIYIQSSIWCLYTHEWIGHLLYSVRSTEFNVVNYFQYWKAWNFFIRSAWFVLVLAGFFSSLVRWKVKKLRFCYMIQSLPLVNYTYCQGCILCHFFQDFLKPENYYSHLVNQQHAYSFKMFFSECSLDVTGHGHVDSWQEHDLFQPDSGSFYNLFCKTVSQRGFRMSLEANSTLREHYIVTRHTATNIPLVPLKLSIQPCKRRMIGCLYRFQNAIVV